MADELILIVEDEHDLAATLDYNLQREGYRTRIAHRGQDALELALDESTPTLILLDLMLPDMSGTEVCRRLRQDVRTRHIPIIMVTARTEEIDRVVGFEVGADDYVTKPYSNRELLLRIRAIIRRIQGNDVDVVRELCFGSLRVDTEAHRVEVNVGVDGEEPEEVKLTALEFKLLTTFLSRRGRVQTREVLLNDVWGMNSNIMTRTVDTHVKRLREKLGEVGANIETLRGVGYRFRAEPLGSDDDEE